MLSRRARLWPRSARGFPDRLPAVFRWLVSGLLYPWLGQDFFPTVDSGQFKLHVRAQTGTRIEETADCATRSTCDPAGDPAKELGTIIDNIGLPYCGINLSYSNSAPVGTGGRGHSWCRSTKKHGPTEEYVAGAAGKLTREFPGVTFYSLPADMVSQILNFGLPAPVDIQIVGSECPGNHAFAEKLMSRSRRAGNSGLRIQQPFNDPSFHRCGPHQSASRWD